MTNYPNSEATRGQGFRRALTRYGLRALVHFVGVLTVGALIMVPFLNRATFGAILTSAQSADYLGLIWTDLAIYLGLAACLWAMVVIVFEVLTSRRNPVQKTLNLERGSVMTETLIILPVFLLLTFGIAQLAVNNVAGLLTNTAAFQSGRTAWLWSSEADIGRRGVNDTMVEELTRVQAAAVLTPVAPGEFIQDTGGGTEEFKKMRGILVGSQLPSFSSDTGQAGMDAADVLVNGTYLTKVSGRDSSFLRAIDSTSGFRTRAARKFTFAYHATDAQIVNQGDNVGVRLTYFHHQAFPLVGRIFGEPHTDIGSRPGFYAEITREFTMPKQLEPNKEMP